MACVGFAVLADDAAPKVHLVHVNDACVVADGTWVLTFYFDASPRASIFAVLWLDQQVVEVRKIKHPKARHGTFSDVVASENVQSKRTD